MDNISTHKLNNKGFTLIELIVVMAIIAILVLLAAPRFLGYTKDADVTAMEQDVKVLADAAEMYHVDNEDWPIVEDSVASAVQFGIGGASKVYPIDEKKIQSSIKNINGDYTDYGLATSGEYAGKVFHLSGIKNKDDNYTFGNDTSDVLIFDNKTYESAQHIPESPTPWFKFNELDDGTISLDGFDDEYVKSHLNGVYPTDISIPSMVNGKKVTKIEGREFTGDKKTSSTFSNVEKVIIPNTITTIGDRTFAFNNKISQLTIPESVTWIGQNAFRENRIVSVDLPDTLEYIGNWSFRHNYITSLTLPKGLSHIGAGAFNDNLLSREEAFIYARNDDSSQDTTKLVSYGGKVRSNLVLPDNIVSLEYESLGDNDLTSVVIPSSVEKIGAVAFLRNRLTSIEIPSSVTYIHNRAFEYNGKNMQSINSIPTSDYVGIWNLVHNEWVKE